ncbi:amidohydrolase family protein [Mesobacterium pallidum]|uniref:amidohydrolase family protein n=1 Tax=Mesobacterium pallidum TaxID=2872037 RepID=UPI001EE15B5B|nr:amidohydrolase family protein [Mesobacterium pallidum]
MEGTLLVRAGVVIPDAASDPIVDGGVLVRGGIIARVGPWDAVRAEAPDLPVTGGPEMIALPGFINAHDHGRGLSPQSLGIDDDLLEPWILNLSRLPMIDARTDTALSALRQLGSGITTTVNSYYHPRNDAAALRAVRQGHADAGQRAAVVLSAMDRPASADLMRLVAQELPGPLAEEIAAKQAGRVPFDDAAWAALLAEASGERIGETWMMAGPISGHWSSEAELRHVAATARALGLSGQMHLLESRLQGRDSAGRPGGSILSWLEGMGYFAEGAAQSLAHGVHLTPDDIARLARLGVAVVTNPSSNLRLRSGVAPVRALLDAGVVVALGLDSMGLDDTTDMFAEMRLAHRLHGTLSAREVLAMVTTQAAAAIGRRDLGALAPGMRGDLLLLDRRDRPAPGMDSPARAIDRVLHYGRAEGLAHVFVDGVEVLSGGRHATLDAGRLEATLLDALPDGGAAPDARLSLLADPLRRLAR